MGHLLVLASMRQRSIALRVACRQSTARYVNEGETPMGVRAVITYGGPVLLGTLNRICVDI
jgi:hypothetical protein